MRNKGLVGGTRESWWEAWGPGCLHIKDEEGKGGRGGSGIQGAEPSCKLGVGTTLGRAPLLHCPQVPGNP